MSILIGIKFKDNPKQYIFKCYDEVLLGDLVVLDTQFGYTLGTVTEIEPAKKNLPLGELKDVVSVVNLEPFLERKAKCERLKDLKKKMDKKVKELQDIAVYEMLSEKDPELKELLSEFKNLI